MESMVAMVSREKRTRMSVFPYVRSNFQGVKPIMRPAMIAATRMLDPVADNQFSEYTAPSAVGLRTTGGTRCTIWCRPTTGYFGADHLSRRALTVGSPHAKTTILKMSQGTHAFATCDRL